MNELIINNKETMTSSQLSELLNYPKKEINRKIKSMFSHKIVGGIISPTLRANSQVDEYNLPELESKMFVAKHDINYLEKITAYWINRTKPQLPDFTNPAVAARAWADEVEQKQIAEQKAETALVEVDRLQGVCQTMSEQFKNGMTPNKFCSQLNGVNMQKVNKALVSLGKIRVDGNGYAATSTSRDVLFKSEFGNFSPYVSVLPKGAKWLYRAYLAGKLPMKKGWDGEYVHLKFDF